MSHKTICYDGERLECVCGLRGDAETREAEQISRAEAQELVDIYSLTATAAVLNAMRSSTRSSLNAIFPPDKR